MVLEKGTKTKLQNGRLSCSLSTLKRLFTCLACLTENDEVNNAGFYSVQFFTLMGS